MARVTRTIRDRQAKRPNGTFGGKLLPTLRALPHLGVLLGCYALLLNLAFGALSIASWLAPQQTVVAEADGTWSFSPLGSLCRFAADRSGGAADGDLPDFAGLACAKCGAPSLALAAAAVATPSREFVRQSHALAGAGWVEPVAGVRSGDLIRAPPQWV
jgi:hypothetical protein